MFNKSLNFIAVALFLTVPLASCNKSTEVSDPNTVAAVPADQSVAEKETSTVFGTLNTGVSINNQFIRANAEAEYAAGVRVAVLQINWRAYEKTEGVWDAAYERNLINRYTQLKEIGFKVTLAIASHYTPDWLLAKPDSQFVNQDGTEITGFANFVFKAEMRTYLDRFFDRIAIVLGGLDDVYAIRLHSGANSEMLYPAGGYMGYDVAAQTGIGLASGMSICPVPGWKPGTGTEEDARQWLDWYIQSMANFADWQMERLNEKGFRGWFEILSPGQGTRPVAYEDVIANRLYPINVRIGHGGVWFKFYELLPNKSRVVIQVSSVADNSGRNRNDYTQPDDFAISLTDPRCTTWSAVRYSVRIAHEYGIRISGENVGYNYPPEFNDSYKDTSDSGMLAQSFAQVRAGKFQTFYWAHSDRLWDGTMPFTNYAQKIQDFGAIATPAMPSFCP